MIKHFYFLRKKWPFLIVIFFSGLVASFLEGLGITFVFPIIQGLEKSGSFNIPFPFNLLTNILGNLGFAERLRITAGLLIAVVLLKGVFLYLNTISSYRMQMFVIKHFRMLCYNQLMRMGMGYFNNHKVSDFQTICNIYTMALGSLFNIVGTAIPNFFNIILLVGMLFILSWKMTLVSLLLVFFASFALRRLAKNADAVGKIANDALKSLNNVLFEVVIGMKTIRIFNREKETLHLLEREVDSFNAATLKTVKTRGAAKPIFESVTIICLALVMIISSFLFFKSGSVNLPSLLIFMVVLFRIIDPVMALNHARIFLKVDFPTYREVFDFLDLKDKESLKNGEKVFSGLKKDIEFRRVTFGYKLNESIVLRDISLTIPKGAKVGIAGSSGAGKSTITELLMRFYDPQEGEILIDGINLKGLDVNSWRRYIGVVSQDVFLFNDTIRNNITFAKPDATQKELEEAARKAHALEFIEALPNKYNTLIGDRGVLLSGGQRQRIAIARAVITDPEIFIFDEATSSLDSESEKIVQQAIDEIGKDRTVITIAHRLSTIAGSDIIFVIEAGRIIEQGTHQELLQENRVYKKLVQIQELGVGIDKF